MNEEENAMKNVKFLVLLLALVAAPAMAQQVITTGDAAAAIPDNTGAATTCQSVTAVSETITDLNVQYSITHTWVGDVTVEVQGPSSTLTIINRPGRNGVGAGDSSDYDGTGLNFSDSHPNDAELMGAVPGGGDAVCTFDGICNYFPNPDTTDTPVAGQGTNLADFNTTDAAGTWNLCVADSAGGDTGTLVSWTLGVNAPVPVELESFSIE